MAREWFDYDPLTGITEYYEETADGHIHMTYEQEVGHYIDTAKSLAASGGPDDAWRKNGVTNYAILPMVVLGQMAKKGIRFLDPNDVGRVVREVNENYPWLKTTYKHHSVR